MMEDSDGDINPIKDAVDLEKLIEKGYVIEGPRHNVVKDLRVFKQFLGRGHSFIPEYWLLSKGYEFVEPNKFTKGFKLAYVINDNSLVQYFRTNYWLTNKDRKIPLYLKNEEKKIT